MRSSSLACLHDQNVIKFMKIQVSAQYVHLIKNENEALSINWRSIQLSEGLFFTFTSSALF